MPPTRLLTPDDVPALTALVVANRAFMAPWDPVRDEGYFTEAGQRQVVADALERHRQGTLLPHVVLDDSGDVVGRITLNEIVRGPFQNGRLGYWVAEAANGRGLATRAVGDLVRIAFDGLGLHRVEAGTLLHNVRSQRVLERNGFVRYGVAPAYLRIAGKWQDHAMYQRVSD